MKLKAVRCKGCGNVLVSRARHDFRTCDCGSISVDGGQTDYLKVSFDPKIGYEHLEVDLDVTLQELYDDWNKGTDKFGIIKGD